MMGMPLLSFWFYIFTARIDCVRPGGFSAADVHALDHFCKPADILHSSEFVALTEKHVAQDAIMLQVAISMAVVNEPLFARSR